MHYWVVLKNEIKIYIKIYIKTAPTCFGAVTPRINPYPANVENMVSS